MNSLKGFTLVELLIVIAVIGVLSAVIISSLGDAKDLGLDAKIKSEMSALSKRAVVEESQNFTYDTVCGSNSVTQSPEIINLITAIEEFSTGPVICNSDTYAYAASVPLQTDYWCVDSEGKSGVVTAPLNTSPAELVCPSS